MPAERRRTAARRRTGIRRAQGGPRHLPAAGGGGGAPVFGQALWIPTFAGMTARTPAVDVSDAPTQGMSDHQWIPAFAGMTNKRYCRHSREGGNPLAFADHACPSAGRANRQRPCRHSREGENPLLLPQVLPPGPVNRSRMPRTAHPPPVDELMRQWVDAPHGSRSSPVRFTSGRWYSGWWRLRTSCSIENSAFFPLGATMSTNRYWCGLSSRVTRPRSASAR